VANDLRILRLNTLVQCGGGESATETLKQIILCMNHLPKAIRDPYLDSLEKHSGYSECIL
jgi:hypothetical protein